MFKGVAGNLGLEASCRPELDFVTPSIDTYDVDSPSDDQVEGKVLVFASCSSSTIVAV